MENYKKKVSLFLVFIMLFMFSSPAFAFDLTVDPVKESYQSGESITVSTDVYGDTSGFSWSITDWDSNKTSLDGDKNSITFNLPKNNSGEKVTAVIEAVYGSVIEGVYGNTGSINIDIEPEESEPLKVVEMYPANGATGVPLDTEIYIKFNKPVEFDNVIPLPSHIQIEDKNYPLTPNEDNTKWFLAAGQVSLERGNEYNIIKCPFTNIKDKNTGETFDSFPEWKFDTKPAEANSIRVENVKANVKKGEKLQLTAEVLAKSGKVFADTVTWSSGNTDIATISPEGLLTGIADGLVEITAAAKNNPAIQKQFQIGIGTETAPLQIINLCPANGESAEALYNSEKYIEFNKPAEFENAIPLPFNIQISEKMGTLISSENGCKWSLPAESLELEKGVTYTVSKPGFTNIKDKDTGSILTSFPEWSFTTQDIGVVIPATIQITDYPDRLNVGESYPLKAVVKDKKGDVIEDFKFNWEIASIKGGDATVDEAGNLTGTKPGKLRLIARADGFPDVCVDGKYAYHVEIRQNFDKHLIAVWEKKLTGREHACFSPTPVGEDGTIYLTTKYGKYYVRAYDKDGGEKAGFIEITEITGTPVLEEIGGKEYLLAPRDKKMCAFDADTGRLEWESEELDYYIGKAYVGLEGNIYAGCSEDGKIYAFNLNTSRYLWSYYVQYNPVYGAKSLTIDKNNKLYVVGANKVFCFNNQGQLQWQYETPTYGEIKEHVELDNAGNVYFIEDVSPSMEIKEHNIYSLDANGDLRWSINKKNSWVDDLFVDEDDSLYVSICDQVNHIEKLTRLSKEDGSVEKEFDVYGCDKFQRGRDGYIYTNKFIFNDNLEIVGYTDLEPVGYADDYYYNLPYMHYSKLALCPDGTLVRVVISDGNNAYALEKVALFDTSNSVPAEIEVDNSEITLYQGGTKEIFAQVKDNEGHIIPFVALIYEVDDSNIAEIDETGKITAKSEGDTNVYIKVQGNEEVCSTVKLHVLSQGEISEIFFVKHSPDSENVKLDEKIESVTGVVGEEQCAQLVVLDQYGQVIQDLPVKWTLSDSSVVQMYNYSGEVMGSSKAIAVMNGLKEGTATVTAELEGYPGLSAQLNVEIKPAPYEILWTMPIDGDWDDKIAYHSQAEDGTLFISNHKKLKAVSSSGVLLWEKDITDKYGFKPAAPVLDESNVYVYDSNEINRVLVALSQEDGSLMWSFEGGLGSIADVKLGSTNIYFLTGDGKLYSLDKNGKSLWKTPLDLGAGDCTLGLTLDEELYYTRGNQVFQVGDDKSTSLIYTEEEGVALAIKEIAQDGRIIMEKEKAGSYSIVSINKEGEKNWEVQVETAVELSCNSSGIVYAVTRKDVNPCLYFINKDGTLKAENVITAPRVSTPYVYIPYYKPLIGSDGIVYISITRLYAVNASDAGLLWQAEFKDGFFKRIAKTATLDKNNVVYLACDDAGFIAVRSKERGVVDESGFYVDTSGISSLKHNSYRNISFSIRNDNETEKNIRVLIALEEIASEKTLNYSSLTDLLAADESKSYNCGLNIPKEGSYQVKIKLLDQDNKVITEKILPVM